MAAPLVPHAPLHARRSRNAPNNSSPPPALPQFSHVSRYWDNEHKCFAARLLPGEYYVTTAHEVIATVLGSCVSACIRDTRIVWHTGGSSSSRIISFPKGSRRS